MSTDDRAREERPEVRLMTDDAAHELFNLFPFTWLFLISTRKGMTVEQAINHAAAAEAQHRVGRLFW